MRLLKSEKIIPLLIVGLGLLAYSNTFRNGFILDDALRIVENRSIRHLWPPWEIVRHTSRPVVQLSLAINFALGGLNPWGYHAFNVVIHIFAALVLYGVVRLTLLSEGLRSRFGDAASGLAGVIALIWLVHPLQTESVTYMIQRGESLMGLFYLLTLYCVIRSTGLSRSSWWRAGAVMSCALGMASKPIMVTAPLVVLLYDRAFLATSWCEVWERRWKLHASLVTTWLLLLLLLRSGSADWEGSAGLTYGCLPPLKYALTQTGVIRHYLRLSIWLYPLCFDYGGNYGWPMTWTFRAAMPALMIIGALFAASLWAWCRRPALGFLGLWFFIILAPTSSFVPVADLVFEHRMYLSLAAVIVLVVVGGFELGRKFLGGRPQTQALLSWGMGGAAVLVLLILTRQRNRDYRSEFSIWKDTVVKCPGNPRAHNNLGEALLGAGQVDQAIGHFEHALRIKPDYAIAHDNLGSALAREGKVQEAVEQFELALHLQPDLADAHYNMGRALLQMGKLPEAVEHYERALQLNPADAEAHFDLGNALAAQGKLPEAVQHWQQAVFMNPDLAGARNNLGAALAQAGKFQEAIEQLNQVLRITPNDLEVRCNLANALVASGRLPEAIQQYEQALRIEPDYPNAQNNLARLLATLAPAEGGDPVRAVALAQRLCERTSNRVAAYLDTLGLADASAGRFDDAIATVQKGIELARSAGQQQAVSEMEAHLQLYRNGQAYRQPPISGRRQAAN